jgi:hypothetical protein
MPTDPNIVEFLDGYKEYATQDAARASGEKHFFMEFPLQLETHEAEFVRPAKEAYRDILSKAKLEQDPQELIPSGNSYYFLRALAKAHRLYRRTRITNACISLSDSKGVSMEKGFVDNLKLLGTVSLNPMIGEPKK